MGMSCPPELDRWGLLQEANVFLHTLGLEERKAFLGLAIALVHADDEFADTEEQQLRALRREMALPPDTEIPDDPFASLPAPFTTRPSQIKVLIELLRLASVDEVFDPRERVMIERIAETFGVAHAELAELEAWAHQLTSLTRKARSFWQ